LLGTLIARGAYREAAAMYPDDLIELRQARASCGE
jgi:hypothetical protein